VHKLETKLTQVTPDKWRRAQDLFDLGSGQPFERLDAVLEQACPDDQELRLYVKKLILRDAETSPLDTGILIDYADLAALLPDENELVEGRLLANRFQLIRRLDEGGMGEVWEAEDRQGGKRVALKAVVSGEASAHRLTELMRDEVRRAQEVNHPNVCRVNEYFLDSSGDEPVAFLTMKLIEGRTLEAALAAGPLAKEAAWLTLKDCAAALDAIHAAGIVHRDFKPRNIMLTGGHPERAVVVDFGISRALTESSGQRRRGGAGTPGYMAPEQQLGRPKDLPASDIYSFAVVACRVLTGKLPDEGGLREVPWGWQAPLRRALDHDPSRRPASASQILAQVKTSRRTAIAVAAGAAASIAGAKPLIDWVRVGGTSLAVLPFEAPADLRELADGFSQDLVRAFQRQPKLRTVPWTSSSATAGPDLAATADQLHAQFLLAGKIRRAGDSVAVEAELLDPRKKTGLWTQRYERPLSALGEIHLAMVQAVPAALALPLATPVAPSRNSAAYQAYLYGRYHLSQRRAASLQHAERYFTEAIQQDPSNAAAHAGLAETLIVMAESRAIDPTDGVFRAQQTAQRALELDPRSADAYAVIGFASAMFDHNFEDAELNFERALSLEPQHTLAARWRAYTYCALGRFSDAEAIYQRTVEVDPLSLPAHRNLVGLYFYSRQGNKLREQCRKMIELEPGFAYKDAFLGYAAYFEGDLDAAQRHAREAIGSAGADHASLRIAAEVLGLAGRSDEARQTLSFLTTARERDGRIPATYLGFLAAAIGDKDMAFRWLEEGFAQRDPYLTFLAIYPSTDTLRVHPRYLPLIARMNLTRAKAANPGGLVR
jgi:TolB-like protein/Tfp pilus assembly protein PilF